MGQLEQKNRIDTSSKDRKAKERKSYHISINITYLLLKGVITNDEGGFFVLEEEEEVLINPPPPLPPLLLTLMGRAG